MKNLHDIRPREQAWSGMLSDWYEEYVRAARWNAPTYFPVPARIDAALAEDTFRATREYLRGPRTETIIPRLHRRLAELRYALHGRLDGVGLVVTRPEYEAFLREVEGTYYTRETNLGTFEGVPLIVR